MEAPDTLTVARMNPAYRDALAAALAAGNGYDKPGDNTERRTEVARQMMDAAEGVAPESWAAVAAYFDAHRFLTTDNTTEEPNQ